MRLSKIICAPVSLFTVNPQMCGYPYPTNFQRTEGRDGFVLPTKQKSRRIAPTASKREGRGPCCYPRPDLLHETGSPLGSGNGQLLRIKAKTKPISCRIITIKINPTQPMKEPFLRSQKPKLSQTNTLFIFNCQAQKRKLSRFVNGEKIGYGKNRGFPHPFFEASAEPR